jgi:hypothetical protein
MNIPTLEPPLRLGLVFFGAAEEADLRAMVRALASARMPWVVVDHAPVHALLLARGTRAGDSEDLALLRLGAEAERATRRRYGDALPQMALRKPLREVELRLVLEMAAASLLPDHVEAVTPHTRPVSRPQRSTTSFRPTSSR